MIDFSSKHAWKRPFKNAKKLLLGRGVQAVLSLGYLAMATRALGVEGFGVLTLIVSTIALLGMLASFQSAQFILRFGAKAITSKDPDHFVKVIRFGVGLELLTSVLAVLVIWVSAQPLAGLFSIDDSYVLAMKVYALVIPFILVSQAAAGCLQLLDRHDIIGWQFTISPTVKFFGAGFLFLFGGGVLAFLIVWAIGRVLGSVMMCYYAWRKMHELLLKLRTEEGEPAPVTPGRFGAPEVGAWLFLWSGYVRSTSGVDIVPMLVASVMGPEGAGLVRIAHRIADSVSQPVRKLLAPAVMTDMAWLNAQGNNLHRRKMVFKTGAIAGGGTLLVAFILMLFGHEAITLIAGREFIGAYGAMVFMTIGMAINAFYFTIPSMLVTAGKVWPMTLFNLANLLLFAVYLPPLVSHFDVTGAGMAFLLRVVIISVILSFLGWPLLKKQK